jgi:hypothetical protein
VIGIPPEYFLDEMSQDEMTAIYKAKNETDKMEWEQTRLLCFYNVVSMNGTKVFKKPGDLFKLPWEKGYKVTSKEAKERLNG